MDFYLSNILSSSNDYKIINRNKKELVQFAIYPDDNQYSESNMEKLLLSFIKQLNSFPLYIHVISSYSFNFSNDFSNTRKINTAHFEYFYTVGQINTTEQLIDSFSDAYSDATNGQLVIISSENDITLIKDENAESALQFEFNFDTSIKESYFLTIHADGDCWDFISNFNEHPYKNRKLVEES